MSLNRLPGSLMGQLCAAVVAHYSIEKLRQLVRFHLDKDLDAFAVGPDKEAIVFALVDRCDRDGQLLLLLAGIQAANPHPHLASVCDAAAAARDVGRASITGQAASEALLLNELPPLPMINRHDLRSYLRRLAAPGNAFRTISISGPTASGKSHSLHLLTYVAAAIGYEIASIDLTPPFGVCSVSEVVHSLAAQMRLPVDEIESHVLKDQPKDERLSRKFSDWLAGYSRVFGAREERWWIVLDGLDRPAGAPVRDLLVPHLLLALAQDRLKNITIILLGDNAQRIPQVRWCSLHENARQLDRPDLQAFLGEYATAKGLALRHDELEAMTEYVSDGRRGPYDHEAMESIIPRLCRAVADVLGKGA